MLYTIGHSTHTAEALLELLKLHKISCVVDVRSKPFSRIAPQFNKDRISSFLNLNGIIYMHLPDEFGARKISIALLDKEGKVDFEKVRQTESFKEGIKRVKQGLEIGYSIALLCAEANPFDCHRFVMISYQFAKDGIDVYHILKDGTCLTNKALDEMLLKKYAEKLPRESLFEPEPTHQEKLDCAYRLRNKDIAYLISEENSGL